MWGVQFSASAPVPSLIFSELFIVDVQGYYVYRRSCLAHFGMRSVVPFRLLLEPKRVTSPRRNNSLDLEVPFRRRSPEGPQDPSRL